MPTETSERTQDSKSSTLRESLGDKTVRWIERLMVHGEGDMLGQRVRLRDDQRLFLYTWQELDVDGGWWYDEGYFEAPSGVGKTQELAWIAAEAFAGPTADLIPASPNVIVQANSVEQAGQKKGDDAAEGIFGRIVQVLTHKNCPLAPLVQVLEDRIVFADGRPGRIRLIPARGTTTDGGLPTLYLGDEVQDWIGGAKDAYVRNSKGTTKTRMSRALSGSTPGSYAGQGSVGWELHQRGELGDDDRFLYRKLAADPDIDIKDPQQLREQLPLCNPGIDDRRLERLVRRAAQIPAPDFKRFHCGLWVEADVESWLAEHPGAWERCEADIEIPSGHAIAVGVDVGLNRDSMSVAFASRVDDRVVVRANIWRPERDRAVDIRLARLYISELADEFELVHVAYDPRYFAESAATLEDEGVAMLEIPQTAERMAPADAHLFSLVLAETVAHNGHALLAQHINAAVRRPTERGWYLSKNRTKRHMDAARATSMAVAALDLWVPDAKPQPFMVLG